MDTGTTNTPLREGDHSLTYDWSHSVEQAAALREDAYSAAKEIISVSKLSEGDILVVGCSTSEVCGAKIGSESRPEVAQELCRGIMRACAEHGVYLAAQCCEHLNRALIIEKKAARERSYEIVNAVPVPKAGGSFAAAVYAAMDSPAAIEHIRAEAGIDIGDTLIGMHLKDVAVPVRLSVRQIGQAHVAAARTRPRYIGGQRANYDPSLA